MRISAHDPFGFGQADFTGGTGLFSGASGSAQFNGTGEFTSERSAIASLTYSGSISLVPEPGSGLLVTAGMAALALGVRRRNGVGEGAAASAGTATAPCLPPFLRCSRRSERPCSTAARRWK